tara:strand:- start:2471 stop:2740 length:270 start_codon:yes stop_codon:yes gene_type:complete
MQASTMATLSPHPMHTNIFTQSNNNFHQVNYQSLLAWSIEQNNSYPATIGTPINTLLNLPIALGVMIKPLPIVSRQDKNGLWIQQAILN